MGDEFIEAIKASGISEEVLGSALLGGVTGVLIALGFALAFLLVIGVYVYYSWAWYSIAKKMKHKNPGLVWIPIVKKAIVLQLGGFHWAWIFLILIPILGWIALFVLWIIATWRIFEARNYPGWFSLAVLIPQIGFLLYLIALGFVAWSDKKKRR